MRVLLQLEDRWSSHSHGESVSSVSDVNLADAETRKSVVKRLERHLDNSDKKTRDAFKKYVEKLRGKKFTPLDSKDYQPPSIHDGFMPRSYDRAAFVSHGSKLILSTSSVLAGRGTQFPVMSFTDDQIQEILSKAWNRYALTSTSYYP